MRYIRRAEIGDRHKYTWVDRGVRDAVVDAACTTCIYEPFVLSAIEQPHRQLNAATASPPTLEIMRGVRYDTRCYFNVRLKANMSQLNLPHGTDN